jgi:hypothetical protein
MTKGKLDNDKLRNKLMEVYERKIKKIMVILKFLLRILYYFT